MSTSLLYHAFGVRGDDSVRAQYLGGEVIFTEPPRGGSPHPFRGGRKPRQTLEGRKTRASRDESGGMTKG